MNEFIVNNKLSRITTQNNVDRTSRKVKPSLTDAQNNKNITQKTQLYTLLLSNIASCNCIMKDNNDTVFARPYFYKDTKYYDQVYRSS